MTRYRWEGIKGEGEYLWQALEDEFNKSRDSEYTAFGKYAKQMWEGDVDYFTSKDTDEEYEDYCKNSDAEVPKEDFEKPVCKGCGHKLLSRLEWAEDCADSNSIFNDIIKEIAYQFDNIEDNEYIAEAFKLNPQPIEAYDEDENDWFPIEEYVLRREI